jgi:hypothetical protein
MRMSVTSDITRCADSSPWVKAPGETSDCFRRSRILVSAASVPEWAPAKHREVEEVEAALRRSRFVANGADGAAPSSGTDCVKTQRFV